MKHPIFSPISWLYHLRNKPYAPYGSEVFEKLFEQFYSVTEHSVNITSIGKYINLKLSTLNNTQNKTQK